MVEYINKDRAYQTLADEPFFDNADRDEIVLPVLAAIPTVDVVPVVHGRWINLKGGLWDVCQCSVCNSWCPTTGISPNYCPVCGAKMDGDVE